jgi:hypothetical protein
MGRLKETWLSQKLSFCPSNKFSGFAVVVKTNGRNFSLRIVVVDAKMYFSYRLGRLPLHAHFELPANKRSESGAKLPHGF